MKARLQAVLRALRARRPLVDHVFQAAARNSSEHGGWHVSVITLPGFLSFFPLLALAFAVAGFVASYDPGARDQILSILRTALPGLIGAGKGQIDVHTLTAHKGATGAVGLVGLAFSGLGLISALRGSTRAIWRLEPSPGNVVVAKLRDLVALVTMGIAVAASFTLTGGATAAATEIVRHSPLPDGGVGPALLRVAAIALAVLGDFLLFAVAFRVLPQAKARWRDVADGALIAAIGFEVLKAFGAFYLRRTTGNALYGTFAAVIGLLVWTNLVARLYVFAAAWAVTAPYQPDTLPSGTAGTVTPHPTRRDAPDGRISTSQVGVSRISTDARYEVLGRRYGTAALGAAAGAFVVLAARAARRVLPARLT
ncbi:MAG TPA: YihY/virulence factor BrkB family protein [Mycobacteriales bacterium]